VVSGVVTYLQSDVCLDGQFEGQMAIVMQFKGRCNLQLARS